MKRKRRPPTVPLSRLRRRSWSVSVAAVVVAATIVGAALAHHGYDSMFKTATWGPNCQSASFGNYCRTDNSTLTYYIYSHITNPGTIDTNLANQYEPTDLALVKHATLVDSGGSETDTVFYTDSSLGFNGWTYCDDAINTNQCDQHYVAFNSTAPGTTTICHETGHSVGLTHPAQASPSASNSDSTFACMTTNQSSSVTGTHNRQQIDAQY